MHKTCLKYEVCYGDTDQMGVIYYANYLVFFERARTRLLDDLGFPYTKMEEAGYGLPVMHAEVDYKASAAYGAVLDIFAWCDWIKGARLRVNCEVYEGDRLLATGHTIHACINLMTHRPAKPPEKLVKAWAAADIDP